MNPFEPPKPAAEKLAARADFKLVPYDRFKYLTDLAPDQVLRRLEGVSRLVRGAGSSGADPKGAPNQPDALEILNAGGAPVNLSMRRVLVYQDGSGTADATSVSRSSPTKIERRSFRASFTSC